MKFSAETLKNIDYKQFALNHGEKFVVGFVALFVLYVLWGTAWFPISKTPEELTKIVEDTQRKIDTAEFPPEEKQKFGTADQLEQDVARLFSPVDVGRYRIGTNVFWPLYTRQEPIKEPEWLPVEHLIVDEDRVLVPMRRRPAAPEVAQVEPAENEAEPDSDLQRRFSRRDTGGSRGSSRRRREPVDRDEIRREAMERLERFEEKQNASDTGPTGPTFGKGLQFVSLRAIFPLHRQVELLSRATNLTNPLEVSRLIQFKDFEIQRQVAVAGPDPWSGPWREVHLEIARQLMTEIAGVDPDIVDVGVQSHVFTMPLPARVMGRWGAEVAHPEIENYTLSSEEIERHVAIQRELVDRFKDELEKEREKKTKRGGWAETQYDMQAIYDRVNQPNSEFQFKKTLLPDLATMTPEEQSNRIKAEIQKQVNASGQLLLFRYLDFAVEPGQVYRYRIRLTIFNPFFDNPPQYLADPSVGEGETRTTEWSEPSPPVQVQTDSEYYLVNVNSSSGISTLPKVSLDVFQWHPEAGTLVEHEMDLFAGAAISDRATTEVLRPVEETFQEETIKIDTKSMVIDALAAPVIDPELHPDLVLNRTQAREGLGINEQALIMDRFGSLRVIDSVSQARSHREAQSMLRLQGEAYADLRPREEEEEDELDRGARRRARNEDRRDMRRRSESPNQRRNARSSR